MKEPSYLTFQLRVGGKKICSVPLSRLEYETIRRTGFCDAIERIVQRVVHSETNSETAPRISAENKTAAARPGKPDPKTISLHLRQFLIELHQNRYRVKKKRKDNGP